MLYPEWAKTAANQRRANGSAIFVLMLSYGYRRNDTCRFSQPKFPEGGDSPIKSKKAIET